MLYSLLVFKIVFTTPVISQVLYIRGWMGGRVVRVVGMGVGVGEQEQAKGRLSLSLDHR